MPDPLSAAFAALADPTRRDIVQRLTESDAGVTELAEPYGMSIQAISKHITVLEEAGLVSRSRNGRRRPVHLEGEVLSMVDTWIERYARHAEARYRRLDAVLAETAPQPAQTSEPSRKDAS
jgi:DNA-binding transcriptional ArsR family regulator